MINKILLGSAVTVMLITGCTEEKKATSEVKTQEVISTKVDDATSKQNQEVNNTTPEKTIEEIKENSSVVETAKETIPKLEENTKQEVTEKVEEKISNLPETVKEETPSVVSESKEEVAQIEEPNGEVLYKSCVNCHGQKAEKEALGKSQIIAGWDKQRIIDAMNGYKAGTYGGVMKNIMKGQVLTKTDSEIQALATFISNL